MTKQTTGYIELSNKVADGQKHLQVRFVQNNSNYTPPVYFPFWEQEKISFDIAVAHASSYIKSFGYKPSVDRLQQFIERTYKGKG